VTVVGTGFGVGEQSYVALRILDGDGDDIIAIL
jgi:hypothetical protein